MAVITNRSVVAHMRHPSAVKKENGDLSVAATFGEPELIVFHEISEAQENTISQLFMKSKNSRRTQVATVPL